MEKGPAYQDANSLEDVIPEHELIEWGGLKKETLASMRNDGRLPYSYLDKNHRFFFVADVLNLLKMNRVEKPGQ